MLKDSLNRPSGQPAVETEFNFDELLGRWRDEISYGSAL